MCTNFTHQFWSTKIVSFWAPKIQSGSCNTNYFPFTWEKKCCYLPKILLFTQQGDNVKDRFLAKKWSTTTIATFVGAMHKAALSRICYSIVLPNRNCRTQKQSYPWRVVNIFGVTHPCLQRLQLPGPRPCLELIQKSIAASSERVCRVKSVKESNIVPLFYYEQNRHFNLHNSYFIKGYDGRGFHCAYYLMKLGHD